MYVVKLKNVASAEEEESVRKKKKKSPTIVHVHMSSRHFPQDRWGQKLLSDEDGD